MNLTADLLILEYSIQEAYRQLFDMPRLKAESIEQLSCNILHYYRQTKAHRERDDYKWLQH
jgi:hypothetical protein